jgi:hypothetical protein
MLITGMCGILWRTDSFADIPGIKALLRIISDRPYGLHQTAHEKTVHIVYSIH